MCHGSFMNTYRMLFSHLFELFLGSLVPVMCTPYHHHHYISPLHHAAKWMSCYNAIMVTIGKTHCFYNKQYIYIYIYIYTHTHTYMYSVQGFNQSSQMLYNVIFPTEWNFQIKSRFFIFSLTFKAFVMFMTFYYFKVTYM